MKRDNVSVPLCLSSHAERVALIDASRCGNKPKDEHKDAKRKGLLVVKVFAKKKTNWTLGAVAPSTTLLSLHQTIVYISQLAYLIVAMPPIAGHDNLLGLVLHLIFHHLAFLALFLDPGFWASLSQYHDNAMKTIGERWHAVRHVSGCISCTSHANTSPQLQQEVQTPAAVQLDANDDSEDEYEEWVDDQIKRFQYVLREIDELEAEFEEVKKAGLVVKRAKNWVDNVWRTTERLDLGEP